MICIICHVGINVLANSVVTLSRKERIDNTDIAFVSQIVQEAMIKAAVDTERPAANLPLIGDYTSS